MGQPKARRWCANGRTEPQDLIPPYDLFIRVASSSNVRYLRARLAIRVPLALGRRPLSRADLVNSQLKGSSIQLVSGATDTSYAFVDALRGALTKAGV